jgi:hypothetical protein
MTLEEALAAIDALTVERDALLVDVAHWRALRSGAHRRSKRRLVLLVQAIAAPADLLENPERLAGALSGRDLAVAVMETDPDSFDEVE